jgi:hypothetical protein
VIGLLLPRTVRNAQLRTVRKLWQDVEQVAQSKRKKWTSNWLTEMSTISDLRVMDDGDDGHDGDDRHVRVCVQPVWGVFGCLLLATYLSFSGRFMLVRLMDSSLVVGWVDFGATSRSSHVDCYLLVPSRSQE